MKNVPVGPSNFKKFIEKNYYFVDKSLFIKDIITNSGIEVILIPRPRRFGKTLNLSTLKYFFEKTTDSHKHLFKDLKIAQESDCMKHQGQYPVIFITFKDIKESSWETCFKKINGIISNEFFKHKYLLETDLMSKSHKNTFNNIINKTADQHEYEDSLKNLSMWLSKYHNKKTIILIDEYDTPVNAGYIKDYYEEVIEFMRGLLCGCLKDNSDLEFSIITGILRVARESIFSGLNNLKVYSILDETYSDYFGFLEQEVKDALKYFELKSKISQVKEWYDGYNFGNHKIYNPWSIVNLRESKGKFSPYWINTSDNELIKKLIAHGDQDLKEDIGKIIKGTQKNFVINDNVAFTNMHKSNNAVLNLLLFSGYLTVSNFTYNKERKVVLGKLKVPNEEISSLYSNMIMDWFEESIGDNKYNRMLTSLVSDDIEDFENLFKEFVLKSFSYFDVSGKEPEKVYHAFVLGLIVGLDKNYHVKSNRESGYGRYDLMLIPQDTSKWGVIIEFKKVDENGNLVRATKDALKQIKDKKYAQELKDLGIKKIRSLVIAFKGKKVLIRQA
ncbi:MAG: AAA family ATPase [Candidatus Zapsychrus exili]|nr:AAA family ATPase [Candidatus Zapsychrus exili]